MNAIKCPNCGKRMEIISGYNCAAGVGSRAYTSCWNCGVTGPAGDAPTDRGAAVFAARLTREWIARMDQAASTAWITGYNRGYEDAEKGRAS